MIPMKTEIIRLKLHNMIFLVSAVMTLAVWGSAVRIRYAPPYTRNPNLKPVGKGFGFLVFDLKEYFSDMT